MALQRSPPEAVAVGVLQPQEALVGMALEALVERVQLRQLLVQLLQEHMLLDHTPSEAAVVVVEVQVVALEVQAAVLLEPRQVDRHLMERPILVAVEAVHVE